MTNAAKPTRNRKNIGAIENMGRNACLTDKPKLAVVASIQSHNQDAILKELRSILRAAEKGQIAGIGYVLAMSDGSTRTGLAGRYQYNRKEASGAFLQMAVSSAFKGQD